MVEFYAVRKNTPMWVRIIVLIVVVGTFVGLGWIISTYASALIDSARRMLEVFMG